LEKSFLVAMDRRGAGGGEMADEQVNGIFISSFDR
jgi:hypothetical protein